MKTAAVKRRWLTGFMIWTAVGLAVGTQLYLVSLVSGHPIAWVRGATIGLRDWYLWALLALVIWRLADRYPLERPCFARNLSIHIIACFGCVIAYEGIAHLLSQLVPDFFSFGPKPGELGAEKPSLGRLLSFISFKAFFDAIIYWTLVFARSAFNYYRRLQERDKIEAELKSSLAEARLRALTMQLQPHFLFNTLNAIAALVRTDARVAEEMIGSLSDLLRSTLELVDRQEVTLEEELELIQRYLDIEQIRFGDRLTVRTEIAPDVLQARVPPLILQPIIENAMKHGVELNLRDSLLLVSARRDGASLKIEVQDNGPGFAQAIEEGIGLQNTRTRLQQLYAGQGRLLCESADGHPGAKVTLLLPLVFSSNAAAPKQESITS